MYFTERIGIDDIDLKIRWSDYWSERKGSMLIHWIKWMEMHNVTKFRKLLKIIRESNTPDEEKKIREWCEQFLEQTEPFKKKEVNFIFDMKEKIRKLETQADLLKYQRDKFRRNTKPYKELGIRLKEEKKNLSTAKTLLRDAEQNIKGVESDKKFILKCLEIMG